MFCLVLLLLISVVSTEDECLYVGIEYVEKHIPCVAVCDEPVSVEWCISGTECSAMCVDAGKTLQFDLDRFQVDANVSRNGTFIISTHNPTTSNSNCNSINCSLIREDDTVCDFNEGILSILSTDDTSPTYFASYPISMIKVFSKFAGQSFSFCFNGRTNGISEGSVYWFVNDTFIYPMELSSVNIDLTVSAIDVCRLFIDELLERFHDNNLPRHYLYLYKTNSCLEIYDRFLTVLSIPQVTVNDRGVYSFHLEDRDTFRFTTNEISLSVDYKLVDPIFHTPDQFLTVQLITGENSIVNCTVTSTVGFIPKWEGLDVQDLETNCTMNYNECVEKDMIRNCTTDLIECVCVQQNLNGIFSILVEQETVFDSSEFSGTGSQAVLMKSSVFLVICNVTPALENDLYICEISDFNTSVEFSVTSLPPNISTIPHSSDNNTLYFIIFIILFVVTVIVVLVVMVIICRYCLVKRKPINNDDMIPLPPLCSEDKKEFPRYCLNLMELLGEGQFGEVWKATAAGIVPDDISRNIVAIKTIKESATHLDEEDLYAELNIMKKIKPHPNIINLLGYCTKPINEPLYIIMEFALHGNLKHYLRSLRRFLLTRPSNSSYSYSLSSLHSPLPHGSVSSTPSSIVLLHQQQNEVFKDDEVECDCDVGDSQCPLCSQYQGMDPRELYANLIGRTEEELGSGCVLWHHFGEENEYYNQEIIDQLKEQRRMSGRKVSNVGIATQSQVGIMKNGVLAEATKNGNETLVEDVKRNDKTRAESQPERQDMMTESHTEKPHSHVQELLSELDVLNFALQIARGMEHLENMRCLHRDLAARNVLISEGFLLKVADFGLARELTEKDYYRKITSGKLPARWMAIESLDCERIHTHKSDVWSFGVVLWEICSYGRLPYGSKDIASTCESLLLYLKGGNRLPLPEQCSDKMYELMLKCWDSNPINRPSFSDLINIFDELLSIEHGYLPMQTGSRDQINGILSFNKEKDEQSPLTCNPSKIVAISPTPSLSSTSLSQESVRYVLPNEIKTVPNSGQEVRFQIGNDGPSSPNSTNSFVFALSNPLSEFLTERPEELINN